MAKLLILISRSNLVAEYIGKDVFERATQRATGSLSNADIFVESPYLSCVRVIVNSRQSRRGMYGK